MTRRRPAAKRAPGGGRKSAPLFDPVRPPSAQELKAFRARLLVDGKPMPVTTMASLLGMSRMQYWRAENGQAEANAIASRLILWIEDDYMPPEFRALGVTVVNE